MIASYSIQPYLKPYLYFSKDISSRELNAKLDIGLASFILAHSYLNYVSIICGS